MQHPSIPQALDRADRRALIGGLVCKRTIMVARTRVGSWTTVIEVAALLMLCGGCKNDPPDNRPHPSAQPSKAPATPPANDGPSPTQLEKSCAAGSHEDCHQLAVRLKDGVGVAQDVEKATALLRRGCENQHLKSCYLAGPLLAEVGSPADPALPNMLLIKACDGGVQEACSRLVASCPVQFDEDTTHLGHADQAVIDVLGAPVQVRKYRRSDDDKALLYRLTYAKGLMYGDQPIPVGYFAAYDWKWFFLDDEKRVVGFANYISNSPSNLPTIGQALEWAKDVNWPMVAVHRFEGGVPILQAYLPCGDKLLQVGGWCMNVDAVDPETYRKTIRKPRSFTECRLRVLVIADLRHVVRTEKAFKAYSFGGVTGPAKAGLE
jgi:hypothetical protein